MNRIFCLAIFLFMVVVSKAQCAYPDTCTFKGHIQFQNDTAEGDYSIFYADAGHVLDNPVIFIEGLDLDDIFGSTEFNYSGIPSELNSLGYDVVFLNLHDNLTFVQRNAFLIVELIKKINSQKTGSNKLIVAGMNTGAVEARYALSWMEANNIDHQTKCFLSIDGAQRGFNIPITIQMWLNQLAIDGAIFGGVDAIIENTRLMSPIFSQLLYCDLNTTVLRGFPHASSSYISFFNELRSLNSCYGYPTKCKKIAISNGSITGENQRKLDGSFAHSTDVFFTYNFDLQVDGPVNIGALISSWGVIRAVDDTSARPVINAGHFLEDIHQGDGLGGQFWGPNNSPDSLRAYDVCPGSYGDFVSNAAYNTRAYIDSTFIYFTNATFIPTISAFDINTDNFYFDFQANTPFEATISPFDKCYSLGGNYSSNYIDFYTLATTTDITSQISNSDAYVYCEYTDYTIPPTDILAASTQDWRVSDKLIASDFKVENGGKTSQIAGNSITILPGLDIKRGSVASIEIKPCDYNVCSPPASKTNSSNTQLPVLEMPQESTSLEIYPNPTNSLLNIKLPRLMNYNGEILIHNGEGALVKQFSVHQSKVQFSVADLPDGIYSLTFHSNANYVTKRFSIIKN